MKNYKVICIGYKTPSEEKIKELIEFEKEYCESGKVLITPYMALKYTEVFNPETIAKLENAGYMYFWQDPHELESKYDGNARHEFDIKL